MKGSWKAFSRVVALVWSADLVCHACIFFLFIYLFSVRASKFVTLSDFRLIFHCISGHYFLYSAVFTRHLLLWVHRYEKAAKINKILLIFLDNWRHTYVWVLPYINRTRIPSCKVYAIVRTVCFWPFNSKTKAWEYRKKDIEPLMILYRYTINSSRDKKYYF